MPLQNRVTPDGSIIATPHRGLFMGNRGGEIHRPDKTLTNRRWTSRAWITCVLEFKGWRENIMVPGRYTQLFFLDEATALAAGHRPCALCRRADYLRFTGYWAISKSFDNRPLAPDMDAVLHDERLDGRQKRTFDARFAELPEGVMIRQQGEALLIWNRQLLVWSPAGYAPAAIPLKPDSTVEVLTPPSLVGLLKAGYQPVVHPTGDRRG